MKKFTSILLISTILGSTAATAGIVETNPIFEKLGLEVNGNVEIGNDILWRGISVTDKAPGIQGNFRVKLPTQLGKFYADVDAKSTVINPLMTYSAGYEISVDLPKTKYSENTKVYGNAEYKAYQFQSGNHGFEANDLDFNTVYTKIGFQNLLLNSLNVYGVAEFVDKENSKDNFNTENRYGATGDYTITAFSSFVGDIEIGAQYFDQDKWGENFGGYVSNEIYENTDLKFTYNHFDPDTDTQSYVKENEDNYVLSLNYKF
jgi:hypothetical protein